MTGEARSWDWLAVRVSGVALAVMVPLHVVTTFVARDGAEVTSLDQLARWGSPAVRAFDWGLVVLGLGHAAMALRPVISGWRRGPVVRAVVGSTVMVTAAALVALVTFAAFTVPFH
jgi:succinate dehydrogenase / fumarate reductase membrane anchor subunit